MGLAFLLFPFFAAASDGDGIDGGDMWVPLLAAAGPIVFVVSLVAMFLLDRARRRAIADGVALRKAHDTAENANRAKTDFLANMSHEFRTPLNSIIGFSGILLSQTFGPIGTAKYLEYAQDINDSGNHLLELINRILDISLIETGAFVLEEQTVDAANVVVSCHRLIEEFARQQGVILEVDVAETRPAIHIDELRVRQILLNLLSNAIKFTSEGGTVLLAARTSPDGGFLYSVSDNGIGMTDDELDLAMSTFGQIQGPLARRFEGAGLGLPLSRRLAELHGGTLDLTSRPGAGTTATFSLPKERNRPSD